MGKLAWCLGKDKGIRLVEPSETISSAYVKSSQESLDAMQKNTGRWRTVAAYYACYESLYALLAKAGIKSEIHECTLAPMDLFGFSGREMRFLSELKGERVAVQYYLQQPKALDEKGGLVRTHFCSTGMDGEVCAKELQAFTSGGKVRGTLLGKSEKPAAGAKCVQCGKPAKAVVYVAKQY